MVWRESERYPAVYLHREPLLHPSVCACGCTYFSELYTAHAVPDTGYLRLKVLELLHSEPSEKPG